jgi:hypothetical protein
MTYSVSFRTCGVTCSVATRMGDRLMADEPKTANTQDLAGVEYDAERQARLGVGQGLDPKKARQTSVETTKEASRRKAPTKMPS